MIDIAEGNAKPNDYRATNGTTRFLPELERIQKIRNEFNPKEALHAATDYMINHMDVPGKSTYDKKRKASPRHRKMNMATTENMIEMPDIQSSTQPLTTNALPKYDFGKNDRHDFTGTAALVAYTLLGTIGAHRTLVGR